VSRARGGRRGTRRARNQERIRQIAAGAPSDLEALARLFEDGAIEDDGSPRGRLEALLEATERRTIPGLHTALPFGDSGFAGDRRPGGAGFRDPWASSRNQVGHFLTAVRLQTAPEVVSRAVPALGSIRALVGAPAGMQDAEVALRLTIGHEKVTDPPNGLAAAMAALEAGVAAYKGAVAEEAMMPESARRVWGAIVVEAVRQARGSLATYRAQFAATTDADIAAWHEALRLCARGRELDRRALEGPRSPLRVIAVGSGEGNSVQDLRLSLAGWRFGQLIGAGAFGDGRQIGAWIRRTLG
jgi:hypothetical protein